MGIVERLRNLNPWSELDWPEVARGAADEIERLQRELSTARRTALLEAAEIADALPLTELKRTSETRGALIWEYAAGAQANAIAAAIRKLAEEA